MTREEFEKEQAIALYRDKADKAGNLWDKALSELSSITHNWKWEYMDYLEEVRFKDLSNVTLYDAREEILSYEEFAGIKEAKKEIHEQAFEMNKDSVDTKDEPQAVVLSEDRHIKDYLTDIKNSGNNEKQFYEIVVQIGRREDTGVVDENGELTESAREARQILDEYARSFQERNPNLYLFNAVLHMDEATPHLHLDYIPVAHGYKSKMHTRNSLTKALQEMGIEPAVSKTDTETMHWQQREREYLMEMCRERGLEIEVLGEKRDNYTISEYKAARPAADALTAELEILNAEKEEAENIIAGVSEQVSEYADLVAESKEQLEEINSQIADKEKVYAAYEKKIDTLLAAEKPVKRELALIRQDTKQLPAILGGEPYLKISEKNLNRLMEMAQGAGTLKNLNMAYEKELSAMKKTIDRLSAQVKMFKSKVKQYETFLDLRGMMDAFVEYIRPKTVQEQLAEKKAIVEKERKGKVQEVGVKKKHDIAI